MPLILAPLFVGFGVLAVAIVLYGNSRSSQVLTGSSQPTEQGGLWGWLKHALAPTIVGSAVVGAKKLLQEANKAVRYVLSHWAQAQLRAATQWLHALSTLYHHTFKYLGDLAEATDRAVAHLVHVTLPREIGKAVTGPRWLSQHANRIALQARAAAHSAELEAERLFGRAMRGIDYLRHAVTTTIPREIGAVRARVGQLEREIPAGLKGRLSKVEKGLAFGSLAAVVLRVLARRFPWLFCRNVQNAAKTVCGMDADLFGSLIQDALLIGGTVSLVEMVRELEPLLDESVNVIVDFWQAV